MSERVNVEGREGERERETTDHSFLSILVIATFSLLYVYLHIYNKTEPVEIELKRIFACDYLNMFSNRVICMYSYTLYFVFINK